MRARAWVGAVLAVLLVASCSSGQEEASDAGASAAAALARLDILSTDVAVRTQGSDDFAQGRSGQDLGQGDQVRTDPTGFAEVVYFDGSWQRVENSATLSLTELTDTETGDVVRTGIDQGRAWQRVEALTDDDDAFEVETPVAVAVVRGTAFSIECLIDPEACTFAVVEGTVEVVLPDGTRLTLTAGQRVTLTEDEPPGTVEDVGVDVLRQDEWIAKNIGRDESDPPAPLGGGAGAGSDEPGQSDGAGGGDGATGDEESGFAAEANAICTSAGAENTAVVGAGSEADDVARRQAEILDGALDQLEALEPPPEDEAEFDQMLAAYRRRNVVVGEALGAAPAERAGLIDEIEAVTAEGADRAAGLGLDACVIQSG